MADVMNRALEISDSAVANRNLRFVRTRFGEIAYEEAGSGAPAVFLHGVFLNGFLWRYVMAGVADMRRCIAIDLMAHGGTRTGPDQDLRFESQTEMVAAVLDELGLDRVDLVGNDSGGGIAQIFATRYQDRLRSLTLTNCDTHDNCPPPALQPLVEACAAGKLAELGQTMLSNVEFARQGLSIGFEFPERLAETTIRTYLEPIFGTAERTQLFDRLFRQCFLAPECHQTFVLDGLKRVQTPALVVWGTADVFFETRWAHWLGQTLPGTRDVVLLDGAKLFFPEERPQELISQLRTFWASIAQRGL